MNNKKQKSLCTFIVAMLAFGVLAMVPIMPSKAVTLPNFIKVYPASHLNTAGVGETFTVNVTLTVSLTPANGTGLYGYEFKLFWNKTLLTVDSVTEIPPTEWAANWFGVGTGLSNNYNATHGRYWKGITALAPALAVNLNNRTVTKFIFHAVYQPFFPEPNGVSALDIRDDKLVSQTAPYNVPPGIPHDTFDGTYQINAVLPLPPILYLEPKDINSGNTLPLMGTFTVDIEIRRLAPAHDMWGWQAYVWYNTTQLGAVAVVEGSFLAGFEGPSGTFFTKKFGADLYGVNSTYEQEGCILIGGMLLAPRGAVPTGTGVLATITFRAELQTIFPIEPITTSTIDLNRTKIADTTSWPPPTGIPHFVEDYLGGLYERNGTVQGPQVAAALYHVPYKTIGRIIDVYTETERWPAYTTTHIGAGPDAAADAYAPQENVTLFANVTYNEDPVQNKNVKFIINGPPNSMRNITIVRTAFTDSNGVATVTFAIPWPCNDSEEVVFGEWSVLASVSIREMQVDDTLTFQVGWIVEILSLETVDSTGTLITEIKKGETIYFNITYKNIAMIPRNATFTVVVYDDLGVPIGYAIYTTVVDPGTTEHFNWAMMIPKWAFVGIGTAYANAFTELPYGDPWCPEVSETFQIKRNI